MVFNHFVVDTRSEFQIPHISCGAIQIQPLRGWVSFQIFFIELNTMLQKQFNEFFPECFRSMVRFLIFHILDEVIFCAKSVSKSSVPILPAIEIGKQLLLL